MSSFDRNRDEDRVKLARYVLGLMVNQGSILFDDTKRALGCSDPVCDVMDILDLQGGDENYAYAQLLWDSLPAYLQGLLPKDESVP